MRAKHWTLHQRSYSELPLGMSTIYIPSAACFPRAVSYNPHSYSNSSLNRPNIKGHSSHGGRCRGGWTARRVTSCPLCGCLLYMRTNTNDDFYGRRALLNKHHNNKD
ncbi:hypothetical protein MTP99_011738 [Tenebrio molitor]|nr:hypothetical protein MTP99_011738 [Tenebrio molitor]